MDDQRVRALIRQIPTAPASDVLFDKSTWVGVVPNQLRAILATGLAGMDGSNGQAVINAMPAGTGGEFQSHHDGPTGLPTYGFPGFYVSYVPLSAQQTNLPNDGSGRSFYQIVGGGN